METFDRAWYCRCGQEARIVQDRQDNGQVERFCGVCGKAPAPIQMCHSCAVWVVPGWYAPAQIGPYEIKWYFCADAEQDLAEAERVSKKMIGVGRPSFFGTEAGMTSPTPRTDEAHRRHEEYRKVVRP